MRNSYFIGVLLLISYLQCFHSSEGCLQEERTALLHIKRSLNHPNGSALSDWIGTDCCQWNGVSCLTSFPHRVSSIELIAERVDEQGRWYPNITSFAQFKELQVLILVDVQIGGWIHPEGLWSLGKLEELDFSSNYLRDGNVAPWISNLTSLRSIDLSSNQLSDVSWISNLTSLRSIDLSGNQLSDVSCSNLAYLGSIDLSFNQLSDVWISNLTSLISIDLSDNQLSDVSWISNLTSLRSIALLDNQLSDASWISNLTSLRSIDMSNNTLKDLPGLCQLKKLEELNLDSNIIEGPIDPCIGHLYSLRILDLYSNHITGSIPKSLFSNLTNLQDLHLSSNQLDGVFLFSTLANLSSLNSVGFADNYLLVETEIPTFVPSFRLNFLFLSNCIVNNRSGGRIPSFLSTQTLLDLDMSQCSLSGSIPSYLFYNVTGELLLSGNHLSDSLPQSHDNRTCELNSLDLSNNKLYGTIPSNIDKIFNQLVFPSNYDKLFHQFRYLNLSGNSLQGSIPPSLGQFTSLWTIDFSNNDLSGHIPHEFTKNNTSLSYLSFSNNNLDGEILPRSSNMTGLKYLFLDGNHFTGGIPESLSYSVMLTALDVSRNDLSGMIPSWLSDFRGTESLLMSGNKFHGGVPLQLCLLDKLHLLDLSGNFLSGTIPHCLSNVTSWKKEVPVEIYYTLPTSLSVSTGLDIGHAWLSADFSTKGLSHSYKGGPLSLMTGIDLSMNLLTGCIPSELGDLRMLRSLNLSSNQLNGSIPNSFQSLDSLESLDLSHNLLTGRIPSELTKLNSLESFSVGYNNLSGPIPSGSQFSTFNASSYIANPGLCGWPLERNCSTINPSLLPQEQDQEDETEAMDNPLIYYLFIAASFAIGFWGVITMLACNKNLRVSYFRAADRWIDACAEKISGLGRVWYSH